MRGGDYMGLSELPAWPSAYAFMNFLRDQSERKKAMTFQNNDAHIDIRGTMMIVGNNHFRTTQSTNRFVYSIWDGDTWWDHGLDKYDGETLIFSSRRVSNAKNSK